MRRGPPQHRSSLRIAPVIRRLVASALALALAAIAVVPDPATAAGDVVNGLRLTELMCARCHFVGPDRDGGDKGPSLPQLVNRMRLDPAGLRAWLGEAHPAMPSFNLALGRQEIDDIVAYLESLRVH